jgi:hypothetical protein
LLGLRRISGGFRDTLFFSASRVGGGSNVFLELFDGPSYIPRFGFGGGPSRFGCGNGGFRGRAGRFRGGAALFGLRRFRGSLRGALLSALALGGNSSAFSNFSMARCAATRFASAVARAASAVPTAASAAA